MCIVLVTDKKTQTRRRCKLPGKPYCHLHARKNVFGFEFFGSSFQKIIDDNVDDPKRIEEKMSKFTDLLRYNIAFLQGRLPYTFYYLGRWGGKDGDQNTHVQTSTQNLIELQHYGVFTFDGQSDYCHQETITKSEGSLKPGDIFYFRQRSYVAFFAPKKLVNSIVKYVKKKRLSYTLWIQYPNEPTLIISDNFYPSLTEYKMNDGPWKPGTRIRKITTQVPKGIKTPLVSCIFVVPKFCEQIADLELLNIVKKIGFSRLF